MRRVILNPKKSQKTAEKCGIRKKEFKPGILPQSNDGKNPLTITFSNF